MNEADGNSPCGIMMTDQDPHHAADAYPAFVNEACPWLPAIDVAHDHRITRRHGAGRGGDFYQDALRYAQSQWRCGKPAQALLQLDKAWMAEPDLALAASEVALPYRALVWILARSKAGDRGYLGNPVRHFQHLASRMSGPRAEVRSLRAWVCMHLAERVLPRSGFPRDGRQMVREGLWVPGWRIALAGLSRLGCPGEACHAEVAIDHAGQHLPESS